MEKPHIEITVAEDKTKENQATNKEIQKPENPEIQEIYNKPNNSVNNANDANVLSSARDEIQNVSAAQSQNVSDSIYFSIRNKFMLKVFGILMFQLAFTFVVILICQTKIIKDFLLSQNILAICLSCVCSFIYIVAFIIFICSPDLMRRVPINYIILFITTICITIDLVYLCIFYRPEIIVAAITFLFSICLGMFFIALFNKIEIELRNIALIGLLFLGLNYGILAAIYRSYYLYFLYCLIIGIIYALFIAYDTTLIRDTFSIDDYAFAALTLYFDIIRLFILILRLLGFGGEDN